MLNIIQPVLPSLERFSKNFEEVLGKHQLKNFQTYLAGLCLELKRKNLQTIDNCRLEGNYDSFHHFLSQSPWDEGKLNEKRLKLLQGDRRTKTSRKGALIIDDTGCKKTGTHTEGAKPQRLGSEGRITNCNIVATSHYMDETNDFPIGLVPYIPQDKFKEKGSPEFHTKIDFAIRLIKDALQKRIQFGEVLIDNWYLCRRTVEFCERENLYWLSNLKRNDILYRKRRKKKVKKVKKHGRKRIRRYHKVKEKLTVEELVMFLLAFYFNQMAKIYKDGKEQICYIWGANFKVSFLNGIKRIVVSKPDPYTKSMDEIDVYVTNDLSLGDKEIVSHASRRWKIEDFYRDAKDNLGFDQYQVRSLKVIKRHWYLVFLAYTFLKISKLKGVFQRVFKPTVSLNTLGDLLKAFRKLSFLHFYRWLKGHTRLILRWHRASPIYKKIKSYRTSAERSNSTCKENDLDILEYPRVRGIKRAAVLSYLSDIASFIKRVFGFIIRVTVNLRKYRDTRKKKYWERLFAPKVPLYLFYAIQRE